MTSLPVPLRGLVIAFAMTAAAVLAPATAQAATTASLVRNPAPAGSQIFSVSVTATYDTNAPTTEWRLEFDLPSDTFVLPWSELGFGRTGNRWFATYRSALPQRAGTFTNTSFIFGTTTAGSEPTLSNCLVNGRPCTYTIDTDTVAPTLPGNPTATRFVVETPWGTARWVRLTWAASTDNRRLSGYEVSANGQVLATTTATATTVDVTYTTQQTTYSIRAFDWVQNFSAPATVVLPAA
jgi:hypothetical protein